MAKNVLQHYWDVGNQEWIEIHPITKSSNIYYDSTTVIDEVFRETVKESKTMVVGSGEDFETIGEGLKFFSKFYPEYRKEGITLTLLLKSGFVVQEQIFIQNLNLGYITIESEDDEVEVDPEYLTEILGVVQISLEESFPAKPFILGSYSQIPVINTLFKMAETEDHEPPKVGYVAMDSSSGFIREGCGFKDFTMNTACMSTSVLNAEGSIITGSVMSNVLVGHSSSFNGAFGDFSNSLFDHAVLITDGSTGNLMFADISGAGLIGLRVAEGSKCSVKGSDCSNAGDHGVRAEDGCFVNVEGANLSNADKYGVYATGSSTVEATGADMTNCGREAVLCRESTVNVRDVDGTDSKREGLDTFNVSCGGIIIADQDTVGTFNQTPNQISSHGIIFKEE